MSLIFPFHEGETIEIGGKAITTDEWYEFPPLFRPGSTKDLGNCGIKFFFDSPFCYCYSLKLAYTFNPHDKEMHEWIVNKMDFDNEFI